MSHELTQEQIDAADTARAKAALQFIGVLAGIAAGLYLLLYTSAYFEADDECLKRGAPRVRVDMSLKQYCVALDVAVPLADVKRFDKWFKRQ